MRANLFQIQALQELNRRSEEREYSDGLPQRAMEKPCPTAEAVTEKHIHEIRVNGRLLSNLMRRFSLHIFY